MIRDFFLVSFGVFYIQRAKGLKFKPAKMHNGSEWYWNLNLHRDQLSLVNSSIANASDLPISSSLYTSAVLNDNGICVGMRNVHLKSENHPYLQRLHKMPTCCSNQNVVGQRNQQIWATAYDRMRFSTLTDPSMAIHSTQVNGYGIHRRPISPYEFHPIHPIHPEPVKTAVMFAETNPFHLFGDSATLSSFKSDQRMDLPHPSIQSVVQPSVPMHFNQSYADLHTMNSVNHSNRTSCNNVFTFPSKKSNRTMSCNSYIATTDPNASQSLPNNVQDENESQSDHVAPPPKKKWMRNYMKSKLLF